MTSPGRTVQTRCQHTAPIKSISLGFPHQPHEDAPCMFVSFVVERAASRVQTRSHGRIFHDRARAASQGTRKGRTCRRGRAERARGAGKAIGLGVNSLSEVSPSKKDGSSADWRMKKRVNSSASIGRPPAWISKSSIWGLFVSSRRRLARGRHNPGVTIRWHAGCTLLNAAPQATTTNTNTGQNRVQ